MAVERARVPERLAPPHASHQLLAREHSRRVAGECDQQVVLLRRQLDRAVGHPHPPRADIDRDRTRAHDPRAPAQLGAPQHRRDPGPQFRVGERLPNDVVAASLEYPDPLQPVGVAAQHNQRRVGIGAAGEPLAGADRVDELERLSVDVDQDQVRVSRAQQRERLRTVGRGQHPVAVGGEVVGVLCPGRLCARSGRPVMSGPAPSRWGSSSVGRASLRCVSRSRRRARFPRKARPAICASLARRCIKAGRWLCFTPATRARAHPRRARVGTSQVPRRQLGWWSQLAMRVVSA